MCCTETPAYCNVLGRATSGDFKPSHFLTFSSQNNPEAKHMKMIILYKNHMDINVIFHCKQIKSKQDLKFLVFAARVKLLFLNAADC